MITTADRMHRRGAILAVTMACLMVVGLLAGVMLRQFVIHHRRSEQRQHQMQAFWLCESALSRAAAQLRSSPDYTGETWEIQAGSLGTRHPAVAEIQVRSTAGDSSVRHLIVEAHYPRELDVRVISRRETRITLPETGESP